MLEKQVVTQVLDFVRVKPRTMQEVAQHLDRNWRTAERYVDTISAETGMIATRTFREGTRGALKVVYWNAIDAAKGSAYQERLLQKILAGRRKEDFSPFDLYQFVPAERREAIIETKEFSEQDKLRFNKMLQGAQHQLLSLSGNLSWIDLGPDMVKTIEGLAKRGVNIRILTRIDVTSEKNVRLLLGINHRIGRDAIEIRHCEQPLRAAIVDDNLASVKEVLSPAMVRELKAQQFIFYLIRDAEWIAWLQKVFWHLWGTSVDAQTRLDALATLHK